jgi:hypothetical protein
MCASSALMLLQQFDRWCCSRWPLSVYIHIFPHWEAAEEQGSCDNGDIGPERQFTGCIIEGSLNSSPHVLSLLLFTMFRTAARSFAVSAWRSAESLGQLEAASQTAINISKAQGIGQRGFLDGKPYLFDTCMSTVLTWQSNWQNPTHPPQEAIRRDWLQRSRESRVPKPWWLRKGPRRPLRRRECRAPRPPTPRRDCNRRHSWQHGDWACTRLPLQGLQTRHIHAQHAVARQGRPVKTAWRRSLPRACSCF